MVHKIKDLCKKQGISIASLERQADIAERTIQRWDTSLPSVDKVFRVALILNTTVEDLMRE